MTTNTLAIAAALSDQELLVRIESLAGRERDATVELIAHLAALDLRPSVFAAQGSGSLFGYCTEILRLSEDAACNRIEAARTCRRFPVILDLLSSGALTLTSVRMLGPHLTAENHEAVLARASGRRRRDLEALVAELAPRPDVPTSVRKLPGPRTAAAPPSPTLLECAAPAAPVTEPPPLPAAMTEPAASLAPAQRPVVQAIAPERDRVQFTIGRETHAKLRRLQDLLRSDRDPATLFDRGITLLLEKVERTRLGKTSKPRPPQPIRRAADDDIRTPPPDDPYIPAAVRRAVWERDGGRCAFVSKDGRGCTECRFLEFHHIRARALGGRATVENISLRCRRHNQYEADLIFGPCGASTVPEAMTSDGVKRSMPVTAAT
jgi:hypothetical protein